MHCRWKGRQWEEALLRVRDSGNRRWLPRKRTNSLKVTVLLGNTFPFPSSWTGYPANCWSIFRARSSVRYRVVCSKT